MTHQPPAANPPADPNLAPPASAVSRASSRRVLIVQIVALVVVTASVGAAVPFARELQANPTWSYLGLFLLSIQSGALFMLPGFGWAGIAAFAVLLDNLWAPVLVGTTGQVIGEMVSYLLGVTGSPWIRKQAAYQRVERWIRRWGLLAIAVIAAVPNPLFDIAGAIAGASGLGWWKFFLASWAGRLLKNLGFALAGLGAADFVRQWIG